MEEPTNEVVGFTPSDARRIDRTVQRSEQEAIGGGTPRKRRQHFGSGASIIRTQITTDPDCDAGEATAEVVDVLCGGTNGISIGDTVTLTDPMDFLTGNPALLVGHQFFAVKMENDGPYGDPCSWDIIQSDDLGFNC